MVERCTITSYEVWRSTVFVEFSLAADDVLSSFHPRPFYVLCKRISYLPLVSAPAVNSFRSHSVDIHSQDLWFEYTSKNSSKRIILRCDLPLGVLYDSLVTKKREDFISYQLFKVTIRFTKFPIAKVIRCWSTEMTKRLYVQSLKQAIYTLHGNTRIISSTPNLLEDLWSSVTCGNLYRSPIIFLPHLLSSISISFIY